MKKIEQLIKEPDEYSGEKIVLVYYNSMILVEEAKKGNPIPEYKKITAYYDLSAARIPIGKLNGIYYSAL